MSSFDRDCLSPIRSTVVERYRTRSSRSISVMKSNSKPTVSISMSRTDESQSKRTIAFSMFEKIHKLSPSDDPLRPCSILIMMEYQTKMRSSTEPILMIRIPIMMDIVIVKRSINLGIPFQKAFLRDRCHSRRITLIHPILHREHEPLRVIVSSQITPSGEVSDLLKY